MKQYISRSIYTFFSRKIIIHQCTPSSPTHPVKSQNYSFFQKLCPSQSLSPRLSQFLRTFPPLPLEFFSFFPYYPLILSILYVQWNCISISYCSISCDLINYFVYTTAHLLYTWQNMGRFYCTAFRHYPPPLPPPPPTPPPHDNAEHTNKNTCTSKLKVISWWARGI